MIHRFKNSTNVELLKYFAKASFKKSNLSNSEEAIDIFDEIILQFSNTDDPELLEDLYNAQLNKAYITEHDLEEKEETINLYDDIIRKFSTYRDEESQLKVDNALFYKSFLLMEEDSDTSMEIFDSLIEKYRDSGLPAHPHLKYSIVNNIELSLTTNKDDSEYQELAQTYLTQESDAKAQIEMIEILKEAQESDQEAALQAWQEQHQDFVFENWSFKELQRWNDEMETSQAKTRIHNYLTAFMQHNPSTTN